MALTAILAELVLMRVFMATGAVTERNTPELLEFLTVNCLYPVAFCTVDGLMLPDQGKPRIGVVKLRGRLE
jgi:hypothetical protein